ncbi:NADPH:quinone reductase [Lignipirellula cremea]|uniref:Quinone oxidoreductase 1 n=1 Tax=Lignipirellula cremea TaxID=2528010 RepID=A0A518E0X9_9BACT|nr:NADPH:quinone reductase [Lignipirellula cremea]QDU97747.1 Quinone oxidoreductase 1 [Lignipirellula cremea]
MKAAYIEETGPPQNIQYGDLPQPSPGPGQVLIKVAAAAINPVDTYIRNGANYWPLPQPFIIGCDAAGEVVEVGEGASRFQPGDRVWTTNQGLMGRQGVFAEYAAVDEDWVYAIPDGVDAETAAANALVGVTAHLGLSGRARLAENETLFLHGGSGGVGSMVLQMAKAVGARVMTTAGSEEKMAVCRELGADLVVNYKTDDVDAALQQFAPGGVNVFWETQREPNFEQIVSRMAERGRIVLMAGRDARPVFPVGPFYVKELSLLGVVMFKATAEEMRVSAEQMNAWMAAGKLRPQIGARMPLAEAAAAHQLQEENTLHQAGTLTGKIVLTP